MVCLMISQLAHAFTVAYLQNSQCVIKKSKVLLLCGKCLKLQDECLPVVVILVVGILVVGILVVIPVVCLVVGC